MRNNNINIEYENVNRFEPNPLDGLTSEQVNERKKQGLINTIPGKGCFVSAFNKEIVFEAKMREIEEKLEEAIDLSNIIGLTKEELILTLESLYEGE